MKSANLHMTLTRSNILLNRGGSREGDWGDRPPKTYKSYFIPYDFVQFGKQHLRYKAILPPIILSLQCCEVYLNSLIVVNA